jgi:hypothetical protein
MGWVRDRTQKKSIGVASTINIAHDRQTREGRNTLRYFVSRERFISTTFWDIIIGCDCWFVVSTELKTRNTNTTVFTDIHRLKTNRKGILNGPVSLLYHIYYIFIHLKTTFLLSINSRRKKEKEEKKHRSGNTGDSIVLAILLYYYYYYY